MITFYITFTFMRDMLVGMANIILQFASEMHCGPTSSAPLKGDFNIPTVVLGRKEDHMEKAHSEICSPGKL